MQLFAIENNFWMGFDFGGAIECLKLYINFNVENGIKQVNNWTSEHSGSETKYLQMSEARNDKNHYEMIENEEFYIRNNNQALIPSHKHTDTQI